MDLRALFETILAPAIDARAPYAKVMIGMLVEVAHGESDPLREALQAIAALGSVDRSGEWEGGLRDIIRSMTDCAKTALSPPQGQK